MAESRGKNSIKNISFGITSKVLSLLLSFASRTVFIKLLGEECLGLNGLFTTILSLLSLAELGIGEAIAYYLYEPINSNNHERLRQLVQFYKLCYRVIGAAIFGIGLLLIPALPYLVNFETDTGYNLYLIYVLYLLNTSITYFLFSYPQTVLNANQKQYVVTIATIIFNVVMLIGDIIVLFTTHNYIWYLVGRLVLTCVQNFVVYLYTRKKYPYISEKPATRLSMTEIKAMFKDVYAVFVVKAASKLIDSTDNLFISVFLGTVIVGYNSNYLLFITAATSLIYVAVFALGASVGNYGVNVEKAKVEEMFRMIDVVNFIISYSFAIFLFSFCSHFISIMWGEQFVLSVLAVALMSFNFYMTTSLYSVFMFRNALGIFNKYKYFQLASAILNIALDFALIKVMGIEGLFLATVISNITLATIPFMASLYKQGFDMSAKNYILTSLARYVFVAITGAIVYFACTWIPTTVVGFVYRVLITVGIVCAGIAVVFLIDCNLKKCIDRFKGFLVRR